MADLVVGLSKTAVQLLADKVKSAIKEEAEQWKTVQRDLVFITGEFEMMQAFLDTATEEHVRNKIVRTWVRQVRDLSNDVEDCIDFVLHLDTTKRSWWLRLLPSCSGGKTGAELPVDEAVAETTLLRARVLDVSQRNIRYNLIADSSSKPEPAAMDPVEKTAASSFDVLINAVKKSGPLDLAELIARNSSNLHVVSVCGTEGDLVKVVVVRRAYSDARICTEFACRAWVKLVHPFNPHEFIRSLMTQFFTHSCQEQGEVVVGLDALERMQQTFQGDLDVIKEFAQKVNTHRYLIVLEDVCTMVQWDAIRSYLPDRKKGSRIVVLTHHPVVASQCTGEPCRVSEIGQFSPGHSVRVYYEEGFQYDRVHSFIKTEHDHSLFNYGILGRDTEMEELFERIQKRKESGFISVWGIPGVGKSALVEAVYQKLRTSREFNRHAWVNVSHPFNPTNFCRSLLVAFHMESTSLEGKYAQALRAEDPIKECRNHLHECVCLFVIDGVQSNEDWDWIKSNLIQYGDSKSCIIIITSEESVAKHCAINIERVYNVKGLHDTAAIELFEKVLLQELALPESSHLPSAKEIGKNWWYTGMTGSDLRYEAKLLLSKCGGLPKVIITVSKYLANKPEVFGPEMRRLTSDNLLQELVTNPEFDSLRDIQAWMHSYLRACPRHLKKYMLYLSIFPPNIIVRRRRLIRRWVSEGYSKGTDSVSTENYAEKIFDEVAALSIMQPVVETTKVIGYRLNGFFREYVLSRPVEETILFPVEVSALEEKWQGRRLTTEAIGQHLAIGKSKDTWEDRDQVGFESLDLSRLRSLTLFDRWFCSFYVSDRMRVLRVLDLENAWGVNDYRFQELRKLPSRLKFLSLRGQSEISRLPDSVCELLQLQTLDIRDTAIVTLPTFITKLRKLQYIRAGPTGVLERTAYDRLPPAVEVGSYFGGIVVPRGIGRLEALQTLAAVRVNTADGVAILDEIVDSLPQLKKLELTGLGYESRRFMEYLFSHGYNHLESLSLQFKENIISSLDFSEAHDIYSPKNLRSLKMSGQVDQLLPWSFQCYRNLVKLTLEMTTLFTEDVIDLLGSIPDLRTLRLRVNKDEDGELQFPNKNLFMKLQVLQISCKSKLHLRFDDGAMEKLEHLKLHCIQGSNMQVSGLEHQVSLKQVWLLYLGFIDDALKQSLQQQLDKHPKKPALTLERTLSVRW